MALVGPLVGGVGEGFRGAIGEEHVDVIPVGGHGADFYFQVTDKIRSEDVTAEELSETKSFYSGYFPLQFETPNQVASQMSTVELYGLGNNYLAGYLDNIAAVTAQSIRRAAEKYIHPDKLLIVVVGKGDVIRESLKKIAPVTELELADL